MSAYADVQNAMTLRRCRMSEIIGAEVAAAFPALQDRLATADRRKQLQDRLIRAVRIKMSEPFELTVLDMGNGKWSVDYQPLMTDAEAASLNYPPLSSAHLFSPSTETPPATP